MKKEWKKPHLEMLHISGTMAKWTGDSWDGFFIGRYNKPVDPEGPGDLDS